MIAEAIWLSRASLALWVQKPTRPLRLRVVFSQSLMRRTKVASSRPVQPVGLVVEQPGVLAAVAPGAEAGGEVAGVRPPGAAEQLAQVAEPPVAALLGEVGVDRLCDQRPVLGVQRAALSGEQLADPVG